MKRWAVWLIPLGAMPVLALLAYGFRVNPREIPSPLVGRWASWCMPACYAVTSSWAPSVGTEVEAHHG